MSVFSLLFGASRLYISFYSRLSYILYCVILAPFIILMFAILSKVLFNVFSDCLALSMANSMNYLLSQLTSRVMLNIWTAVEPGGLIYLVQGQQCPNSLLWHTVNPDFLPWWVIVHACRSISMCTITHFPPQNHWIHKHKITDLPIFGTPSQDTQRQAIW